MRLASILFSVVALAATPPTQIDFEGRISIISALPDGTLISLYTEGRPIPQAGEDGPEQHTYLRTSADSGRTWSRPQRAFSYPAGKGSLVHPVYSMVDRKGWIHAFNVRYFSIPKRNERQVGHSELMHCASPDGGKTWTQPKRVDFGHGYTGAINSIIQLKSGRLLAVLSYMSDHFVEAAGQFEFRTVTFFSDDQGETWHVAQDNIQVPLGPQVAHPGAIEPVMVELRDGRVWMIIRTQTLRFWETFSRDGGKTWTPPVASRFMAPDSPGAFLRLKDGRLIFCWNDIASYPNGITGHYRQYLYAAISRDDGKTWTKPKLVAPLREADKAGSRGDYPFLCEAKDKTVVLYYTRFGVRADATYRNQHNELVRIDPEWLAGL